MFMLVVILLISKLLLRVVNGQHLDEEKPTFRILAPEFVCPKDDEDPIDKPDESVIMIQTPAGAKYNLTWQVRWAPLPAPTQRFTLMIWRAVRRLEAELNGPQPLPYYYVIDNTELLHGIDYRFTVTATTAAGHSLPKTFHIDNAQGDKKLDMIEGKVFMFSLNVLGSQVAYADTEYVVEAKVTMCQPTEDYHFLWTIRSEDRKHEVAFTKERGARLVVPAKTLQADGEYTAEVQVVRTSNSAVATWASRAQILKKAAEYIQFMRRKNNSHQQDIDDLKRQNSLLEAQIRTLEKAQATGNYMEGQEFAMKSEESSLDTDSSDGEGTTRRVKKLKIGVSP